MSEVQAPLWGGIYSQAFQCLIAVGLAWEGNECLGCVSCNQYASESAYADARAPLCAVAPATALLCSGYGRIALEVRWCSCVAAQNLRRAPQAPRQPLRLCGVSAFVAVLALLRLFIFPAASAIMWRLPDLPEDPMLMRNRERRESEMFAQAMLGFPLVGDQDLRHHLHGYITMHGARKAYWEFRAVYQWIQALCLSPHNEHLLEPKVTVLREMAGVHLDWLLFWAGYEQLPGKPDRLVFPVNVEAFAWLRVVLYELRNGIVSAKGLMNMAAPALVPQPLAAPVLRLCPLVAPAPVASSGMCPGSSSDGTTPAPLTPLTHGLVDAEIHDKRVQEQQACMLPHCIRKPCHWNKIYSASRDDGSSGACTSGQEVGSHDPKGDKPQPCTYHHPNDLKQNCKHCYAIFQWREIKLQVAAGQDCGQDCGGPDAPQPRPCSSGQDVGRDDSRGDKPQPCSVKQDKLWQHASVVHGGPGAGQDFGGSDSAQPRPCILHSAHALQRNCLHCLAIIKWRETGNTALIEALEGVQTTRFGPPPVAAIGGVELPPPAAVRTRLPVRQWLMDAAVCSGTSSGSQQSVAHALAGQSGFPEEAKTTQDHEPGSASR